MNYNGFVMTPKKVKSLRRQKAYELQQLFEGFNEFPRLCFRPSVLPGSGAQHRHSSALRTYLTPPSLNTSPVRTSDRTTERKA